MHINIIVALDSTVLYPHFGLLMEIQHRNILLKRLIRCFINSQVLLTVVNYCVFVIISSSMGRQNRSYLMNCWTDACNIKCILEEAWFSHFVGISHNIAMKAIWPVHWMATSNSETRTMTKLLIYIAIWLL